MKNLRLHQSFTRQEFERVLSGFQIQEVPKEFYTRGWIERGDGSLKYGYREKEIWEICYFLKIFRSNNFLLIYSSLDRSTVRSRGKDEDAIRTILVDDSTKPMEKARRRLNRVGTWKKNLIARVLEYTSGKVR